MASSSATCHPACAYTNECRDKDTACINKMIAEIMNDPSGKKFQKNMGTGSCMIRPSGNPMTAEQHASMLSSGDMKVSSCKLVSVNKLEVCSGGNMAYAVTTGQQCFNYKGVENDDVSVFLHVFEKDPQGEWKIVSGMRSNGRLPSEPLPQFTC